MAVLALMWLSMLPGEPQSLLPAGGGDARELAALEDRFAADRGDLGAARALADRYLKLEQPQLAIAALRSADPELLKSPGLAQRLARAYEASGRVLDALTTTHLAYTRCARVLGSSEASRVTPVPSFGCSESDLASLRVHREALMHLARWDVQDPARDHRTPLAYEMAEQDLRLVMSVGHGK